MESLPAESSADEWDAEGFEIPSLKPDNAEAEAEDEVTNKAKYSSKMASEKVEKGVEKIYLGPHGTPPSQAKHVEVSSNRKKQRLKQKLKEAEKRGTEFGRENKVEALKNLMGSMGDISTPQGGHKEWLDPHCHESQFERSA